MASGDAGLADHDRCIYACRRGGVVGYAYAGAAVGSAEAETGAAIIWGATVIHFPDLASLAHHPQVE